MEGGEGGGVDVEVRTCCLVVVCCLLVVVCCLLFVFFFFSSRRRHTRLQGDWSSDVCSSDLAANQGCFGVAPLTNKTRLRFTAVQAASCGDVNGMVNRVGVWQYMEIGRASCRERV